MSAALECRSLPPVFPGRSVLDNERPGNEGGSSPLEWAPVEWAAGRVGVAGQYAGAAKCKWAQMCARVCI